MLPSIEQRLALELSAQPAQIQAAIKLLDEGATVPFIARYRKELTGGLDDTQLRNLEERLAYLRELEERRSSVLTSIEEQGKLTEPLKAAILLAETKQALEDLYLPYKQKRRTKAQIAREAGIAPLAQALLEDATLLPEEAAQVYLNTEAGFADVKAVLDGARQILMEQFSEDAALLAQLRSLLQEQGLVQSALIEGKEQEGAKFRDWFDFAERWAAMPSHRALALLRGRNEGILRLSLVLPELPEAGQMHPCERRIAAHFKISEQGRAADKWLLETVRWAWNIVEYRNANGAFVNRDQLKKVPRLGPKTFEQAAGFLRIMQGQNPLDASAVHPEAYPVVERILKDIQKEVKELVGNTQVLNTLQAQRYTDKRFGLPTVQDILKELDKPGRDPRPEFKTASFREGVCEIKDLQLGMQLEGVVTNVTNFGAFVDVGVHQDGLVHISALSDRFVKDPHSVVKAGQVVKVKVVEVDIPRKRIALTMRLSDEVQPGKATPPSKGPTAPRRPSTPAPASESALGAAFAKALKQR